MLEILKMPNIEAFVISGLVFLLLTFVAGFALSVKLVAIANSAIFESKSTYNALDNWAQSSKALELKIDGRIEHKDKNKLSENIYAEKSRLDQHKELRDLSIGITQRVDLVSTKIDSGFKNLEDGFEQVLKVKNRVKRRVK